MTIYDSSERKHSLIKWLLKCDKIWPRLNELRNRMMLHWANTLKSWKAVSVSIYTQLKISENQLNEYKTKIKRRYDD